MRKSKRDLSSRQKRPMNQKRSPAGPLVKWPLSDFWLGLFEWPELQGERKEVARDASALSPKLGWMVGGLLDLRPAFRLTAQQITLALSQEEDEKREEEDRRRKAEEDSKKKAEDPKYQGLSQSDKDERLYEAASDGKTEEVRGLLNARARPDGYKNSVRPVGARLLLWLC